MEKKVCEKLLFGALRRLLEKEPMEKVSVRQLVKSAGISRSTFYRHYMEEIKKPLKDSVDAITKSKQPTKKGDTTDSNKV